MSNHFVFHLSEEAEISQFVPRPAIGLEHPVVWAIGAERLHNYLLPRDCPRVTYYSDESSSPDDVSRLLGSQRAIIAVEAAWLPRIQSTTLYCYHLPAATFACVDANAGYYHSREPVVPERIERIDDLPAALRARGIELSVLPSLETLRDEVARSTL